MRFESQLSRINCHRFLTGFNYGHLGGNGGNVLLVGIVSAADICRLA